MLGKLKKRRIGSPSPAKLTLEMRVIRRDTDGNVLRVEEHGVIATNYNEDGTGTIVQTSDGPEIRVPKWLSLLGFAILLIASAFFGHIEGVIPAAVVLTNAGEEWLVDKIGETVQTLPQYVDWGTGAGTAAKADSAIFTVAPEARVTATYSKVGSGASAVAQFVATQTSAAGATITNVGFWTASSAGTLVVHADHASTVLAASDQIQYTLTIDPS